ncbi:MAG: cation transporter [Magnetococcales bacterium]|nr:cation transporter [Magnetococcales bacterium]
MIVELIAGYLTGSMALTADGWHMGTHAAALGLAAFAYAFARRHADNPRFTFGSGKTGPLGGFASAVALAIIALLMAVESVQRLLSPVSVEFSTALLVAVSGLVVNLASAWLLGGAHDHGHHHGHGHHDDHDDHDHAHPAHDDHDDHASHDHAHPAHDDHASHDHAHPAHDDHDDHASHDHHAPDDPPVLHQDHNLKGAYLHVLADALTSVTAIVALICGMTLGWVWMDPLMGILGSVVIGVWSFGLIRESAKTLLDAEDNVALQDKVRRRFQEHGECEIVDLHLWRVGPASHACIVSLITHDPQDADDYKSWLRGIGGLDHLTVEVNHCRVCP